jgi:hypothetical protein
MLAAHIDEIGVIATHGRERLCALYVARRRAPAYLFGRTGAFLNGRPGVIGTERLEDMVSTSSSFSLTWAAPPALATLCALAMWPPLTARS